MKTKFMFSKNIIYKKFNLKNSGKIKKRDFSKLINEDNQIFSTMKKSYKNKYNIKLIKKKISNKDIRLFGVGGSILGSKAIYNFLQHKIKKKILFIDNFTEKTFFPKKKYFNLIISKSGNTLETIANSASYLNKQDENLILTENNQNYLRRLAKILKSEIVDHNNFIGGRYSVLSEVGMLPAEMMGLNPKRFKRFNNIVKNNYFINSLIDSVNSILFFVKKKKNNSVIINYDERAEDLFKWYQQLVSESLGKKGKGILPIISNMPQDNHSVMQLYLDGYKNNFFTFFSTKSFVNLKPKKSYLLKDFKHLKSFDLNQIRLIQKRATENVFYKKKIPFRSFEVGNRNEETLGEIFIFFILETIILGRALNVNPYDQPSVELIKKETKKNFSILKT